MFAVVEYMKGGQVVTHPCAPPQRIEFFIRSPSPSPKPVAEGFPGRAFVGFSCFIVCGNMGVNLKFSCPKPFLVFACLCGG